MLHNKRENLLNEMRYFLRLEYVTEAHTNIKLTSSRLNCKVTPLHVGNQNFNHKIRILHTNSKSDQNLHFSCQFVSKSKYAIQKFKSQHNYNTMIGPINI